MSNLELGSLPVNERYFDDSSSNFHTVCDSALKDSENFWANMAKELSWFSEWTETLDWKPPFAKWFAGGKINASFNCLDRYMDSEQKDKVAYIWEGENGDKRSLTYAQLFDEVNHFASALLNLGIKKGDKIAFYMPMVPEFPVAILAATRIGATFSVVFSGFSASSLADRINDSQAKLVITSDGGFRRGKILKLKEIVDEALTKTSTVENVIVLNRANIEINMIENRDVWWEDAIKDTSGFVEPEQLDSDHPLYILYTSGTTGKPKGVLHGTGGYLTYTKYTCKEKFNLNENSIMLTASDAGWINGHTYALYGPLMLGATSILIEDPISLINKKILNKILYELHTTILYLPVTLIRVLRSLYGDISFKKTKLKTIGSMGEALAPEVGKWFANFFNLKNHSIINTYFQTETCGVISSPLFTENIKQSPHGSVGKPDKNLGLIIENTKELAKTSLYQKKINEIKITKPWPGCMKNILNGNLMSVFSEQLLIELSLKN